MNTYSFRAQDDCDNSVTLVRFSEDSIDEIVTNFRCFLLAKQFSKELVDELVPDPYADVIVYAEDEDEQKREEFLE